MLAGHSLAHSPHPTQSAGLISAYMPVGTVMAPFGQTLTQHPQDTHSFLLTAAFLFGIVEFPPVFVWSSLVYRKSSLRSVTKSQTFLINVAFLQLICYNNFVI